MDGNTHLDDVEVARPIKMKQQQETAMDCFMAAVEAFKMSVEKNHDNQRDHGAATVAEVKQHDTFEENEIEQRGHELEQCVRCIVESFRTGSQCTEPHKSDFTSSAGVDSISIDGDVRSNGSVDSFSSDNATWTTESSFTSGGESKSILVATLKRENSCLVTKNQLLEKRLENAAVGRALDAELWAKRFKTMDANLSQALASQRASEIECGAERRRVEHLRNTVAVLNARLTEAEQATCRARMAAVLMEAKQTHATKTTAADDGAVRSDEDTSMNTSDPIVGSTDGANARESQDAVSRSNSSSEVSCLSDGDSRGDDDAAKGEEEEMKDSSQSTRASGSAGSGASRENGSPSDSDGDCQQSANTHSVLYRPCLRSRCQACSGKKATLAPVGVESMIACVEAVFTILNLAPTRVVEALTTRSMVLAYVEAVSSYHPRMQPHQRIVRPVQCGRARNLLQKAKRHSDRVGSDRHLAPNLATVS